MIDTERLNRLTRISENLRKVSSLAQKEERSSLYSYKHDYAIQYGLIRPILSSNVDYQLEFQSLRRPENVSYTEVKQALASMSVLVDGVIKQEIIGDRQQSENFYKEYFIDENKPFTAYQQITNIVNEAVSSLKIIDNYAESSTLDFFLSVNSEVDIKLISMKCLPTPPTFKTAMARFIKEWGGNNFDLHTSRYFHDRYIIIDDKEVWHLGPSLNKLGNKPMMISQILDPDIQKKIIALFDEQWSISSPI